MALFTHQLIKNMASYLTSPLTQRGKAAQIIHNYSVSTISLYNSNANTIDVLIADLGIQFQPSVHHSLTGIIPVPVNSVPLHSYSDTHFCSSLRNDRLDTLCKTHQWLLNRAEHLGNIKTSIRKIIYKVHLSE